MLLKDSPSELLMARKLCTTLPITSNQLKPTLPDVIRIRKKEKELRERMKRNFDKHHEARNLEPLLPGDNVWIPGNNSGGIVQEETNPRSYNVQTE